MASLTKSQLITKILDVAGLKGTARTKQRAALDERDVNTLKKLLAAAQKAAPKGQQKRQQSKPKQSKPKQSRPKAKSKSKAKARTSKAKTSKAKSKAKTSKAKVSRKMPKGLVARVGKVVRGIAAGKIAVKQGKSKPSDYEAGTARQKNDKFAKLYEGVRISKKTPKLSVSAAYKQISGSKQPYYLTKGYRVQGFSVGGGASGPGVVRVVPGQKAPSFSSLTNAQQQSVASFLNNGGKHLRGKGAPSTVDVVAIQRILKQKVAAKKSAKKGAANRR